MRHSCSINRCKKATLKRIRKKSNAIALESVNKNFEQEYLVLNVLQFKVLVGIIRNY